jgi:hypothetical protein
MSFAAHGNWCGPGWSAGQWKNAEDLTEEDKVVPAVDALDEACKRHDINIAEGDPLANKKFYEEAAAAGYYGLSLAQFVKIGGPSLQNYLRGGEEVNQRMSSKRRKVNDDDDEYIAWVTDNSIKVKDTSKGKQRKEAAAARKASNRQVVDDMPTPAFAPVEDMEEEKEDDSVRNALVSLQNFETPDQPVPRMAPVLTRPERQTREPTNRSLANLLDQADTTMAETDVEMSSALALRSSDSNGNGTRGNRETTVKYNMRAEMGIFTETRTAYLPVTFFLSVNNTRRTSSIPLRIRLDHPVNILLGNTLTRQDIIWNGGSFTRSRGLSNDAVQPNERATGDNTGAINSIDPGINKDQLTPFPCTIVGAVGGNSTLTTGNRYSSSGAINDGTCIPAYRRWYAKMYDWAHCMETDYKITYFSGDQNESFQNMTVFEGMNCTSDNNTARIPEDKELQKVMHWPHLKTHRISGRTSEKPKRDYVISGTWTDNSTYPMKMVPNEEDQKTWTACSGTDMSDRLLNYREELLLLHYTDYDSTHTPAYFNVRVDLRYKVQFRDLSNVIRFLGSGTPATYSSDDCEQYPRTAEIIKATTVISEL